jgi:hypothetical protein
MEIMEPTKENTLYLPIKQIYFDQIIAGTKKEEYREIKDTTYKKYLANQDGALDYDDELINEEDEMFGDPYAYNSGKYPYCPIEYKYLNLAVGYAKDRDTALVEVTDITFQVLKNNKGQEVIFDFNEEDKPIFTPKGHCAFWEIVYHLGKVIEVKRKGE